MPHFVKGDTCCWIHLSGADTHIHVSGGDTLRDRLVANKLIRGLGFDTYIYVCRVVTSVDVSGGDTYINVCGVNRSVYASLVDKYTNVSGVLTYTG